jgi:hypothetical protein
VHIGIALVDQHLTLGIVIVTVGSLLAGGCLTTLRRQMRAHGRYARAASAIPVNLGRQHVGIALVQSLPAGIGAAIVTGIALFLEAPLYQKRIIEGQLCAELDHVFHEAGERVEVRR